MAQTLQEHYNSIKSGKGNKTQFLRQAREMFPQYFNQYSDFDTTTGVLKSKQIISEATTNVVTKGFDIYDWKKILAEEIKTEDLNSNTLYQYDGLFTLGANEGKKVKGTCKYIENTGTDNNRFRFKWVKVDSTNADYTVRDDSSFFTNKDGLKYITPIKSLNESVKAEEKETSKEVKDANKNAYQSSDLKNADNVNFNEIMKGFYAELKDPKNHDKTSEEIKAMVVKNLAKDCLHYTKDGMFGEKGVGYVTEAPGLGTPKEAKGKHKSSGYGDIEKEVKVKANVQDSLGDKEAETSMPKKVKEMSVTPKNSAGVKKMKMPGAEKTMKLQENLINENEAVYDQIADLENDLMLAKNDEHKAEIEKKIKALEAELLKESELISLVRTMIRESLNEGANDWNTLFDWLKQFSTDKGEFLSKNNISSGVFLEKKLTSGEVKVEDLDKIAKKDGTVFSKLPVYNRIK